MGFEPTTSSMPSRRAPNCATAPPEEDLKFITASPKLIVSGSCLLTQSVIFSSTLWLPSAGAGNVMIPRAFVQRILLAVVAALGLCYVGDYLFLRVRMIRPKRADPLESLTATRILAIPEKNGKISYEIDARNPELTVTCVHSLFPHYGYRPCWYLKPRMNRPIPMIILPLEFESVLAKGNSARAAERNPKAWVFRPALGSFRSLFR